jgi:hypothetical protein
VFLGMNGTSWCALIVVVGFCAIIAISDTIDPNRPAQLDQLGNWFGS